ncbi:Hypothetical protein CINCED_3A001070 [Cinara cedri]|uniref:Uncharacterized protein n=1 Tax=Cinara cedri TaxID=506608 RepID=A0A5E4MJQ6_9HEMI|nr:Hypothetical protein CINCED_3A001070 [Cinara cedri]
MVWTPSPSSTARLGKAMAVLLVLGSVARGFPLDGPQLDSAVEGVQKYLESSGFPKMTRGEILDFLSDFSRSSRVSRSDNTADPGKSPRDNAVALPQPDYGFASTTTAAKSAAATAAKSKTSSSAAKTAPVYESPLAYGYPLSSKTQTVRPTTTTTAAPAVTAPTIFVTVPEPTAGNGGKKNEIAKQAIGGGGGGSRNGGQKKSVVPSVDLNAYTKFKKIPEARELKIDDDMRVFLGGFGLLEPSSPKSGKSIGMGPAVNGTAQRRADIDDVDNAAAAANTVDQVLLESVLAETGNGEVNASQLLDRVSSTRDHVFNPSDSNVKTVDVNRIAKIVENIRLLTDGDNGTVPLPPDFIQKKIENITASIADIDKPAGTAAAGDAKAFNGYEVFFDDESKEIDSDLPESPAAGAAAGSQTDDESPLNQAIDQPDPLSTDELQQLLEKTKTDVKRQEPKLDETVASSTAAAATAEPVSVTSTEAAATAAVTADSSSEATSTVEVTSDGGDAARGSSPQSAADASPSLSQLAESFGGGETASEPPALTDVAEVPANRPRNGLYFYVDWNSFLTVNEGQKNQVNLRFAPKAGNPAHFLRVAVP